MPAMTTESDLRRILERVRGLVAALSRRLPSDVSFEDLVAAGNLGVATAMSRRGSLSDPRAFEAYVMLHARGAIYDELRRVDPISRPTRAEARRMEAAVRSLKVRLEREPDSDEIAAEMGVDLDAYHALRTRGARSHVSVDSVSDGRGGSWERTLVDTRANAEDEMWRRQQAHLRERLLWAKVAEMPPRQAHVLRESYRTETTLEAIGKDFGVSEARISQIRKQALAELRNALPANEIFSPQEVA